MSRALAVSWNPSLLRFVWGELGRNGGLRVLASGERTLRTDAADGDAESAEQPADVAGSLAALVKELKASRATLILCLNRALVDAATFEVPPATAAELPTLVRNMASRRMTGLNEDSVVDFVAGPLQEGQPRKVTALALSAADQNQITELARISGMSHARAVVMPHSLRLFAPPAADGEPGCTVVISKGLLTAHLLVVRNGIPVFSRSLRLAEDMKGDSEGRHLAAEVQHTLLSVDDGTATDLDVCQFVVVGSEIETAALEDALSEQFEASVHRVSVRSIVEGEAGAAAVSAYAPLVAALKQQAVGDEPLVDFLHPKQPPRARSRLYQALIGAAAAVALVGGGWYYVNSQFADLEAENARLKERARELDELVRDTRSRRNLALLLDAWESRRVNWLDELRDLTLRMPSSPALTIDQFSATSSGSDFLVTFRGTSRSPQTIRSMEERLRDEHHELRTPGIRELKEGRRSVWSFQTSMRVTGRGRQDYLKSLAEYGPPAPEAAESDTAATTTENADEPEDGDVGADPVTTADVSTRAGSGGGSR